MERILNRAYLKNCGVKLLFITLIAFALIPTIAQAAAPAEQWSKTYGGTGNELIYSVQQTSDGGYILAGKTNSSGTGQYDAYLIKIDSNGNQKWSKTFGGSSDDHAYSVQQTSDGGYILAGNTLSYGAGSSDAWLIKTDSAGNQKWSKTFGTTYYEAAHSVQQTSDGGFIVGATYSGQYLNRYSAWLIKTDNNGNQQWNHSFMESYPAMWYVTPSFSVDSVQQTSDGGIY